MQYLVEVDQRVWEVISPYPEWAVWPTWLEARTYNSGMDYMVGSDCVNVHIFQIEKGHMARVASYVDRWMQKNRPYASAQDVEDDDHEPFIALRMTGFGGYDYLVLYLDLLANRGQHAYTLLVRYLQRYSNMSLSLGSGYGDSELKHVVDNIPTSQNDVPVYRYALWFSENANWTDIYGFLYHYLKLLPNTIFGLPYVDSAIMAELKKLSKQTPV